MPLYMVTLGAVFVSLADSLKTYTDYLSNQPSALAMLEQLKNHNKEFAEFIQVRTAQCLTLLLRL